MISRTWLSASVVLAVLALMLIGVLASSAENRPRRAGNVAIQILATASNEGELEECG